MSYGQENYRDQDLQTSVINWQNKDKHMSGNASYSAYYSMYRGDSPEPLPPGVDAEPLPPGVTCNPPPAIAGNLHAPNPEGGQSADVSHAGNASGELSMSSMDIVADEKLDEAKAKLLRSKAMARKRLAAFTSLNVAKVNHNMNEEQTMESRKSTLKIPTFVENNFKESEDASKYQETMDISESVSSPSGDTFDTSAIDPVNFNQSVISKPKFSLVRFTKADSPTRITEKKLQVSSVFGDDDDDNQKVVVEWKKVSDKNSKSLRKKTEDRNEGSDKERKRSRDRSRERRRDRKDDRIRSSTPDYYPRNRNKWQGRNYGYKRYQNFNSHNRGHYGRRGRRSSSSRSPSPYRKDRSDYGNDRYRSDSNKRYRSEEKEDRNSTSQNKKSKEDNSNQTISNILPMLLGTSNQLSSTVLVNGKFENEIKWPLLFIKHTKVEPSLAYSSNIKSSVETWSTSSSAQEEGIAPINLSSLDTNENVSKMSLVEAMDKSVAAEKSESISVIDLVDVRTEVTVEVKDKSLRKEEKSKHKKKKHDKARKKKKSHKSSKKHSRKKSSSDSEDSESSSDRASPKKKIDNSVNRKEVDKNHGDQKTVVSEEEEKPTDLTFTNNAPVKVKTEPLQFKKHVISIDDAGHMGVIESFTDACLKLSKVEKLNKFVADESSRQESTKSASSDDQESKSLVNETGQWESIEVKKEPASDMWSGWSKMSQTNTVPEAIAEPVQMEQAMEEDMDIADSDEDQPEESDICTEQPEPIINQVTYEATPINEDVTCEDKKLTARQLIEKVQQKRMLKEENVSEPLVLKVKNPPSGYCGPKLPPELEKKSTLPMIGRIPASRRTKEQENETKLVIQQVETDMVLAFQQQLAEKVNEKFATPIGELQLSGNEAVPGHRTESVAQATYVQTTSMAPVIYQPPQMQWNQGQWVQQPAWPSTLPYDVSYTATTPSSLHTAVSSATDATQLQPDSSQNKITSNENSEDLPPPPPGVETSLQQPVTTPVDQAASPPPPPPPPVPPGESQTDKSKDHGILIQYTRDKNLGSALGIESSKKSVKFSDGIVPGSEEAEEQTLTADVRPISPALPMPESETVSEMNDVSEDMISSSVALSPPPPPPPSSPPPPPPPATCASTTTPPTQAGYQYSQFPAQMYYPQGAYNVAYTYPTTGQPYSYQQAYMYQPNTTPMYYQVPQVMMQPPYQPTQPPGP